MLSSALPLTGAAPASSSVVRPPPISASAMCPEVEAAGYIGVHSGSSSGGARAGHCSPSPLVSCTGNGGIGSPLTLSLEKLLEAAAASGELRLCSRNLKGFPKSCCKFHLGDTVMAGRNTRIKPNYTSTKLISSYVLLLPSYRQMNFPVPSGKGEKENVAPLITSLCLFTVYFIHCSAYGPRYCPPYRWRTWLAAATALWL